MDKSRKDPLSICKWFEKDISILVLIFYAKHISIKHQEGAPSFEEEHNKASYKLRTMLMLESQEEGRICLHTNFQLHSFL